MPELPSPRHRTTSGEPGQEPARLRLALTLAGVCLERPETIATSLPFSVGDVTAGAESELQAVVAGDRRQVDLPLIIEQSNYFANMMKRAASGETSRRAVADLERFLADNSSNVWENSWVRFPLKRLSAYARQVLERDLLADKNNPATGQRADAARFFFHAADGTVMLRLPISYLIKLALADLVGSQQILPDLIRQTGIRLLGHYLNDNTSPETFSFNVVSLTPRNGMGAAIARETAIRFLMTQLLILYANQAFGITEHGQQAMAYFAPHPPVRQKELNDHIPDSFYRELFMSPCLSGWDKGEDKFRYMQLCHQVLSRSQLNAVAKLKDAGIILNNLVVLPNVSNVSLANNGTHISIGSRRLTAALQDSGSGFKAAHEKLLGDLTIKISEHFLPLFVGSYTAAPFRLAYSDFHPEKALGFLPHELDYTHLRMLWRRWRKKADISIFGQSVTPFGPPALDSFISRAFGLKGDFVPDYRLVDYLVCLLSTDRSPALNGQPGNTDLLRRDLADMGVFDEQMSVYLLYKQREYAKMGFSGFEGRHYSLFQTFQGDMGRAADLQTLITALAYKYMAEGVDHRSIPDDPSLESERRQIFFATAIGLPTFFVRKDTANSFLHRIITRTQGVRPSKRYPGYLRVQIHEYRLALLRVLREDAPDLIEQMGLHDTIADLAQRIREPEQYAAGGRLTGGILAHLGSSSALKTEARDFNTGAEEYYRITLRRQQTAEAFDLLQSECCTLDQQAAELDEPLRKALLLILQGQSADQFLAAVRQDILQEQADIPTLQRLMNLLLVKVHHDQQQTMTGRSEPDAAAPVYRAG
ncbi:hypothetical protein [Trichlorobacter lovleyi]|uniref:Uncharacterized protein n=1 Tax=Trichlorobacter lovleyi (strain ATCC BAA-1151 / DSM 17278 / SZ) TaxID=398767 RepID=B3E3B7_TRIL1|nr:hypothetical protein [Trichlorobacter lovleyi]ACD94329.1 conserved hypothetical protein [Trichlorobacter lovleyi SZ]